LNERNPLIDTADILKATRLPSKGARGAAKFLMMLLGINKINKAYEEVRHLKGIDFVENILQKLSITFEVSPEELKRIPASGPFITVSNHPYGGLDGLILIGLLGRQRPDFKVLGNYLLHRIDPMQEFILPVDPFESKKARAASVPGIKMALRHIAEGHPLGIFPAGEVSSYYPHTTGITDKKWQHSVLKFIRNAGVPVVPVYFEGTNSTVFHLLGLVHPMLRTAKLPSELLNKKNKTIRIRIGNPISVNEQKEFSDIWKYGRYLRAKTYALGEGFDVKEFFPSQKKRKVKAEDIAEQADQGVLSREYQRLREKYLLFDLQNYSVLCAPSDQMPLIMHEIGCLREITFRAIGEGTNKSIDLDDFDLYYYHLFVWDNETGKIVGAYRVGKGKDIIGEYGIRGFYVSTLFRMHGRMQQVLEQSLELGRSFIVQEYQRKPMPLFLLWKGILYFLLKNSEYRYLIGPVSISNRFSEFSKHTIIEYIRKNHYNDQYARYIKPKRQFRVPGYSFDTEILFENLKNLQQLDRLIEDVESNSRMPVLLKKYLQLGGKIVEFNIDPLFNDCLDGLLILDLYDVPPEVIASLSREMNDQSIFERFSQQKTLQEKVQV
jgi:putative hemolysin